MITLKCFKDVIMNDGSIAFKAGNYYEFHMKPNGDIERFANNCLHKFMCHGPSKWTDYFVKELEELK